MSHPHHPAPPAPPRGFACFCEETGRYIGGVRAWFFFGPYLLGAVWLEPARGGDGSPGFTPWLVLVTYLLLFPPAWRTFLQATGLWRKRSPAESNAAANVVKTSACHRRGAFLENLHLTTGGRPIGRSR